MDDQLKETMNETEETCDHTGECCETNESECCCESAEKDGKKERGRKHKKEIEALKEEIIQLKEELATSKNAYFKAYADTENLKKRLQLEAENTRKYRIQSFASEILPVLDNLERALHVKADDENVKNYAKGFEMIYTQLIHILKNEGVEEIDALDKPFDANYHNALMQEVKDGVESGVVIEVLQKGYMLKDRVLRAALVKVSE